MGKFIPIWLMDVAELAEQNDEDAQQEASFLSRELSKAIGQTGPAKKVKGATPFYSPFETCYET